MMLYLTGAANSLAKSQEAPQTDVSKSLGGYISSSLVPNGSVNALFDTISLHTLKDKPQEMIAIALINKFDTNVMNVTVKMVTRKNYIGKFKIAAVNVGADFCMEHIDNRYAEPIQAEFHDVDFYRAQTTAEIKNPCVAGEFIYFDPFNVTVEVTKEGLEGTMEAILTTFATNPDYQAIKLSNNEFSIVSRDENVVETPLDCTALCLNGEIVFKNRYENEKNNESLVADVLQPNEAIGFWIQRTIVPENLTNEEILENYNKGVVSEQVEDIEFIVDYELGDDSEDDIEEEIPSDTQEDNPGE